MQHTPEEERILDDGIDTCSDCVHEHHTHGRDLDARLIDDHDHDRNVIHDHENWKQSVPDLLLEPLVAAVWLE